MREEQRGVLGWLLLITPPPIHGARVHIYIYHVRAGDFWSKYNKREWRERDRAGHQRRNLPACSPIFMAGAARESAPPQPPADTLRALSIFSRLLASRFSPSIKSESKIDSKDVEMNCLIFDKRADFVGQIWAFFLNVIESWKRNKNDLRSPNNYKE